MEPTFEAVLISPAKVSGKREKVGATVFVTAAEIRQLVAAGALAASALELADDPDTAQKPDADLGALFEAHDEVLQKANALQALNEELVKKNQALKEERVASDSAIKTLTANLQTSESDKARMVDDITKAKHEIETLKAELAEAKKPDPAPTTKRPAKAPAKAPAKS